MNTTPPPPPRLDVGTHLTPDEGACLMEWVSILAGEPWTDAPATTQPLLAHLARLVNDAMTPTARQQLLPLGRRLANLDSTDRAICERMVVLVTEYAAAIRPSPFLAWAQASARRHLRRATNPPRSKVAGTLIRLSERAYRHGPAHRAIELAVAAMSRTASPDDHLLTVLERAITLVESQRGLRAAHSQSPRSKRSNRLTAFSHANL